MTDQTALYLPLNPDLRGLFGEAHKTLESISFWQRNGDPLERFYYLRLKFYDSVASQAARTRVTAFAQARVELGHGVWLQNRDALRRAGSDPDAMFTDLPAVKAYVEGEPDNELKVHYDSFLPREYRSFLQDVVKTRLHFFPIAPSLASSLEHFLETYASMEIIKLLPFSFDSRTNAYSEADIAALHDTLLVLARQMIPRLLSKRPVHITIDGSVKKLSISVDGTVVKTSPAQTRGVITLALLRYDYWFSLEEFCKVAFSKLSADPQGDFDDALKFLKRFEPFGWDPDHGLRRIKGAIIEPLVDEAVLRAYLSQK